MDTSKFTPSKSRTYVIPMYSNYYESISFKKFTLPDGVKNTCSYATWYYYNRIDLMGCGMSAFPVEMYNDINNAKE